MKTRTLFVVCFLLALIVSPAISDETKFNLKTATNPSGDSVTVWNEQVGCDQYVFAQRYCQEGGQEEKLFLVSDHGIRFNFLPSVAIDAERNIVIAWTGTNNYGHDWKVYFRLYDLSNKSSDIFQISDVADVLHNSIHPTVAMSESGKIFICWVSCEYSDVVGRLTNVNIYAQQFFSDGQPMNEVYRVNNWELDWWTSTRGILKEVTVTNEKIAVTYGYQLDDPRDTKTVTKYWADIKPFVSISCQQEGSPGDYASLTVSPAITGRNYQVYYCDCLKDNCWSPLGAPVVAESDSLRVIDNGGATSSPLRETKSRFYRVLVHP